MPVTFYFSDPAEAAKYDTNAIYGMGMNGLLQLISADSRFAQFEKTLFAPELNGRLPEQRTNADLAETDRQVSDLSLLLCAHFAAANRAAQKVIEYLIRNFKVYHRPCVC